MSTMQVRGRFSAFIRSVTDGPRYEIGASPSPPISLDSSPEDPSIPKILKPTLRGVYNLQTREKPSGLRDAFQFWQCSPDVSTSRGDIRGAKFDSSDWFPGLAARVNISERLGPKISVLVTGDIRNASVSDSRKLVFGPDAQLDSLRIMDTSDFRYKRISRQ